MMLSKRIILFLRKNFIAYSIKISKLSLILVTLLLMITSCKKNGQNKWTVSSPDTKLKVVVFFEANGQLSKNERKGNYLYYAVEQKTDSGIKTVILPSPLGLLRNDQDFSRDLDFISSSAINTIDDRYQLYTGKTNMCEYLGNELKLVFENSHKKKMELFFRAYNDGIAFRYSFPEKDSLIYTIKRELTGFAIPRNAFGWMQSYSKPGKYAPAYETYYANKIPAGTPAPDQEGWSFPLLFSSDSTWLFITEAGLDSTYCGSHIQPKAYGSTYTIRFPEPSEAIGLYPYQPSWHLPWKTPWRLIIVGNSLNDIITSNLLTDLSKPSIIENPDWVIPGRASWSWWSNNESSKDFKSLKKFIDLASEMNWEYSLVDANWDEMENGNIEQLIEYATSKKVGIILWYNSGGPHNDVSERPRDILFEQTTRRAEFEKIKTWGAKGVKVDFFQSDKQEVIKLYLEILEDAADYNLLVNFHGCTLPRGWNRTFPNLISMEAVKGAESYIFDKAHTKMAPMQNTILPFTRNLCGSMDYTPVTFSSQNYQHFTTKAHELALSVLFESGIIHFADHYISYQGQPEMIREFLMTVPTTWDEIRYVTGFPGELAVIARRKGNTWYMAGVNGENMNKKVTIDMNSIGFNSYLLDYISDSTDYKNFITKTIDPEKGQNIQIDLLPYGGFVGVLRKK